MKNLVIYVHLKKILSYSWKVNIKNVMYWEKKNVLLVTYCKRFHPKSLFYGKVKMTTKRTTIFESFVNIGSFDYDRT
jgi:hypothetical protein